METDECLIGELARLRVPVSVDAQRSLVQYLHELDHWNRTINLTGLHGEERIRRLVAEPAWIGWKLQLSGRLADVGSGNGCPAIPLHLTRTLEHVDLIESRSRRAAFLRHVVRKLRLEAVTVHNERLENLKVPLQWVPEWITIQGVRPTPAILERLRVLAPSTTKIVWITSIDKPPFQPCQDVLVPHSSTRAWIFQLDQI